MSLILYIRRIKGTNYIVPTTSFYDAIIQHFGFKKVINLEHGILS